MKPVVSSLVALALAIAPVAALAADKAPAKKPAACKVVTHKKSADSSQSHARHEKADKKDKSSESSKGEIRRVKVTDAPHKGEPKVEHGATLVPASVRTRTTSEPPQLPPPNEKPSHKNAKEKGAKKPSKKHQSEDKNDGQPARDEDFAELVARIRGKGGRHEGAHGHRSPSRACEKAPVEVVRGPEIDSFRLTACDGEVAPLAIDRLSILVRPPAADRPIEPIEELAGRKGAEVARGIRRVSPALVTRLQWIVDHFAGSGGAKIDVVSGVRPSSVGSLHQTGQAIDFRLENAKNEDVVAFCRTLPDTGCGYYPNSSFVHVDVRDPGTGHVSWIDASGPGEAPRYVSEWPPQKSADAKSTEESDKETLVEKTAARFEKDEPPRPIDDHPAEAVPQ